MPCDHPGDLLLRAKRVSSDVGSFQVGADPARPSKMLGSKKLRSEPGQLWSGSLDEKSEF